MKLSARSEEEHGSKLEGGLDPGSTTWLAASRPIWLGANGGLGDVTPARSMYFCFAAGSALGWILPTNCYEFLGIPPVTSTNLRFRPQ